MNGSDHTWLHECNRSALSRSLAILVALSAVGLIIAHYFYTPLQVDGAWYGYPSYALAQSRDPGENFADPAALNDIDGLRVIFDFDTRTLRTLPMAAWFKAFGSSIWSAKAYSIVELSAMLAAVALVLGRSRLGARASVIVFLLVLSDTVTLALASTDLRPDLAVAALSLVIFALTVADRRPMSASRWVLAALAACLLALTHLTSAIAFSVLGGAMVADVLLNRNSRDVRRISAYGSVLAIGFVGLLFNRDLQALYIPSTFDASMLYYPDVVRDFDIPRLLLKEITRWRGYFFDANVSILAILLATMIALPFALRTRHADQSESRGLIAPLAIGLLGGILVLAVVDPHRASFHAYSVVIFALVLAGLALGALPAKQLRPFTVVFAMMIVSAGIAKLALATKIVVAGETSGISNTTITETVEQVLAGRNADVVLGPAKLWAYIDPATDVLVVDKRSGRSDLSDLAAITSRADLVVIDREYIDFNFLDRLALANVDLSTRPIAELGDAASGDYLAFYSVQRPD